MAAGPRVVSREALDPPGRRHAADAAGVELRVPDVAVGSHGDAVGQGDAGCHGVGSPAPRRHGGRRRPEGDRQGDRQVRPSRGVVFVTAGSSHGNGRGRSLALDFVPFARSVLPEASRVFTRPGCPAIATSSASTSTRPRGRSCSASTRRPRSRRSTAPSRSCRCAPACPRGAPTTTSRHGTTSLYAALEIATGQVLAECHPRHRRGVPGLLRRIVRERTRPASCTSCSTTPPPTPPPRSSAGSPATGASTSTSRPTGASWMNLVESWFSILTRQQVRRGSLRHGPGADRRHPEPSSPVTTTARRPSPGPRRPIRSSAKAIQAQDDF